MQLDYVTFIRQQVGHAPIILNFAGGILANSQNEVLLQKRMDFDAWGLPGGAVEFGEAASATCVREYLEETGLRVQVKSLFGVASQQIQRYPNGDVAQCIVTEFLVEAVGGKLNSENTETAALGYFAVDNLPPIFNQQHLEAIQRYFKGTYPYFN